MTAADTAALLKLRAQLKVAIAESRTAHGKWMKVYPTTNYRARHYTYVQWKKAVAKSTAISKQIQAIEAKYQTSASTCSLDLAKAVAVFEGGRSSDGLFHAYQDSVGVWTIGYGHTASDGAPIPGPGAKPLTATEATTLLLHDLNTAYAPAVQRALKSYNLSANQKQFDALTSFCYNLGPGYFSSNHDIGAALKEHNWPLVADRMKEYDRAGGAVLAGLERRRDWEAQLLLGGTYTV